MMNLYTGQRIRLRKAHPCGSFEWTIRRIGMDLRIQCSGCAHQTWISRGNLERAIVCSFEEARNNLESY